MTAGSLGLCQKAAFSAYYLYNLGSSTQPHGGYFITSLLRGTDGSLTASNANFTDHTCTVPSRTAPNPFITPVPLTTSKGDCVKINHGPNSAARRLTQDRHLQGLGATSQADANGAIVTPLLSVRTTVALSPTQPVASFLGFGAIVTLSSTCSDPSQVVTLSLLNPTALCAMVSTNSTPAGVQESYSMRCQGEGSLVTVRFSQTHCRGPPVTVPVSSTPPHIQDLYHNISQPMCKYIPQIQMYTSYAVCTNLAVGSSARSSAPTALLSATNAAAVGAGVGAFVCFCALIAGAFYYRSARKGPLAQQRWQEEGHQEEGAGASHDIIPLPRASDARQGGLSFGSTPAPARLAVLSSPTEI